MTRAGAVDIATPSDSTEDTFAKTFNVFARLDAFSRKFPSLLKILSYGKPVMFICYRSVAIFGSAISNDIAINYNEMVKFP